MQFMIVKVWNYPGNEEAQKALIERIAQYEWNVRDLERERPKRTFVSVEPTAMTCVGSRDSATILVHVTLAPAPNLSGIFRNRLATHLGSLVYNAQSGRKHDVEAFVDGGEMEGGSWSTQG